MLSADLWPLTLCALVPDWSVCLSVNLCGQLHRPPGEEEEAAERESRKRVERIRAKCDMRGGGKDLDSDRLLTHAAFLSSTLFKFGLTSFFISYKLQKTKHIVIYDNELPSLSRKRLAVCWCWRWKRRMWDGMESTGSTGTHLQTFKQQLNTNFPFKPNSQHTSVWDVIKDLKMSWR